MPQPASPNIEIVVVVSGQPERIRVNANQTLGHVAREALQRSGKLASVLRDQSVVVPQDADVFDLIGRWRSAPASTASAEIITTNMSLVDAIYKKSSAASSTTPAGCC